MKRFAAQHPDAIIWVGIITVLAGFYLTPLFPLWMIATGAMWIYRRATVSRSPN